MSSFIEELWIFSKAGVPIIEIGKQQTIDKFFMGPFIAAIKSFSHEFSHEGLKSFILENNKFVLKSTLNGNAILVCRTGPKIKDKTIHKSCNVIAQIFEELYSVEDITNWNGDISFFDEFRNKLDLYFKMSEL